MKKRMASLVLALVVALFTYTNVHACQDCDTSYNEVEVTIVNPATARALISFRPDPARPLDAQIQEQVQAISATMTPEPTGIAAKGTPGLPPDILQRLRNAASCWHTFSAVGTRTEAFAAGSRNVLIQIIYTNPYTGWQYVREEQWECRQTIYVAHTYLECMLCGIRTSSAAAALSRSFC